MRRIRLRFGPKPQPPADKPDIFGRKYVEQTCELIDLETGKPIPMVTAVRFEMDAEKMVPLLHLTIIPEEIEIEGPMIVHDVHGTPHYLGRQEHPVLKDAIFSWMPPVDADINLETQCASVLDWSEYNEQPPEERRT